MARLRSLSADETPKKSLPRQFRVLALPIGLIALFGFLGHRPGQFLSGYSSYLFNSYVIFNCCFVFIHAINDLVNNHTINFISFIFFNISAILIVFILTYKFYKKKKLYSLLLDVNDAYTNTSSKEHIFAALLLVAVVISSLIYWLYIAVPYMITIFTSDERFEFKLFTMNIPEPTTVKMLELIRSWDLGLKWMCFLCTSYVLSVINLVLAAEYDKIVTDLHFQLDKDNCLSKETFTYATENFFELTSLVDKVNDIFSDLVAVNLCLSLGLLCAVTYGILIDDGSVLGWGVAIKMATGILVLILLLATILNEKVCLKKSSVSFNISKQFFRRSQ